MQDLIYYFIIDRIKGISYDPYFCGDRYLLAYSNRATDARPFTINLSKLKKGLAEKRYRLVKKSH
jgi:hypothetical protein